MSEEKKKAGAWFDPYGLNPAMTELGKASGGMMEAWVKAWQETLAQRTVPAMGFFNPVAWARGDGQDLAAALEGWLGTPEWSDLLSLDSDTMKSFAPAGELAQLSHQYFAAVARLSLEICLKFRERLEKADRQVDGAGDALDIWNDVLDESLMAFNRSDTFADLQRRYVRALMAYYLERRWLVSRMAEHLDMPTRGEVDELSRRVHALERENRRLRRSLAAADTRKAGGTA